jgi:hypothetical protein
MAGLYLCGGFRHLSSQLIYVREGHMAATYVPAARILHWPVALCVIGLVTVGLVIRFDLAPKPPP